MARSGRQFELTEIVQYSITSSHKCWSAGYISLERLYHSALNCNSFQKSSIPRSWRPKAINADSNGRAYRERFSASSVAYAIWSSVRFTVEHFSAMLNNGIDTNLADKSSLRTRTTNKSAAPTAQISPRALSNCSRGC